MTIRLFTLTFLLALCSNAFSESAVQPPVIPMIKVPATVKTDPVQKIHIGGFEAEFEKTTLKEIRDALGSGSSGSIEHSGEAGDSQYWLCYALQNQRFWLISNGEMGGPEHALTQVHAVTTSSNTQVNASCPPVPKRFQKISFSFGWIGTDKKSLVKALGQPSGIQGDRLIYSYEGKKPGENEGQTVEWDVVGYIELKIAHDKVTSLYASHVTSY